jgi:nucleoside-diphosphate-sugar epimerase
MAGGGTTDYAVDIFHKAVNNENFTCFLKEDTYLPMMYMEDAVNATIELMEAPTAAIKTRTSYNVSGMSFSPKEIYDCIKMHQPDFKIKYEPDFRQSIADSWPKSIDDSAAQNDWGWKAKFDLTKMSAEILTKLPAYFNYNTK